MNRIISAAFCLLALCGAAEAEKVKITGGGETFFTIAQRRMFQHSRRAIRVRKHTVQ